MKRLRSSLVRLLAGAVLFLSLAGPGAGNVGGCGNNPPLADPVEHCEARQDISCRRDFFAGRTDESGFADCRALIPMMCPGSTWPVGCEPTPAESDACVTLLGRANLVQFPTDQLLSMFSDCNLCE